MVKLQEVNDQYTITIPREKIAQTGWKKGELLTLDYDRRTGELIVSKAQK